MAPLSWQCKQNNDGAASCGLRRYLWRAAAHRETEPNRNPGGLSHSISIEGGACVSQSVDMAVYSYAEEEEEEEKNSGDKKVKKRLK